MNYLPIVWLFALCSTAFPPLLRAQALDVIEQQLVVEIDARQEQSMSLLETAVNINSGSLNLAGVRAVGELFARAFEEFGMETEWLDGSAFNRAGHLVARYGSSGPHLLLIGQLDTVFEPDSPFQEFQRIDARYARGPGSTDMKGGNVIIVEALRALKRTGALDQMTVTVMLIGDEESSGQPLELGRQALRKAADAADVALGFEDGDGNPATAVIARRGYTSWSLEVTGTPAHSSIIFSEEIGYGAVYEAARILNAFRETLAGEPNLTFNPGVLLAGTQVDYDAATSRGSAFGKGNVIAELASASGDLRTLTIDQRERAKQHMKQIVQSSLPGTHAELNFVDGYPPLAPSTGNRRLLGIWDQASQDLGYGSVVAVDPAKAGAADISFTAGRVDMALDGLGLMGSGGHTVEETADLSTLGSQAKRAAVAMYRLLGVYADQPD
jgi:glutamate carboxypeptidase